MCVIGCSTNAKQSVLITWMPRALAAGAEIRDLAMVGRIEHDDSRPGHRRALLSATDAGAFSTRATSWSPAMRSRRRGCCSIRQTNRFPDGLANSSGLVGKNLMVQANQAVWGIMEQEIRCYKGPPSLAITEHWNYTDAGKDFFGGYAYMSQGPLPVVWSGTQSSKRGLWGQRLIDEMEKYNHHVGLKIVGEVPAAGAQPRDAHRRSATSIGLPVPRVTYSYCDNDKQTDRPFAHLHAAGARCRGRDATSGTRPTTPAISMAPRAWATIRTRSVVNADCRSWDIPNLWICDGSVFPTVGGVNPSLTIQAIACRTADRIKALAARGEL